MAQKWWKSCSQTWQDLCVLHTAQKELKSEAFQSCDGTCTTKNMVESNKLPPTLDIPSKQYILRVHAQPWVWGQARTTQEVPLDQLQNGYYRDDDDQLKPTTTDIPPAPKAIIETVRYLCKGDCFSQRYSCRSKNMRCTDLGMCATQCENDEDSFFENRESDDSDNWDHSKCGNSKCCMQYVWMTF